MLGEAANFYLKACLNNLCCLLQAIRKPLQMELDGSPCGVYPQKRGHH